MTDAVYLARIGPDPAAVACLHKVGPDDITDDGGGDAGVGGAATHLQCEGFDVAGGVWVMRLRRVPAVPGRVRLPDEYGQPRRLDPFASLRVPGWRSLLDAGWQVLRDTNRGRA